MTNDVMQKDELLQGLRYAGTAVMDEFNNMNEYVFDLELNSGEVFTVLLVDAVTYKGTKYCLIAELDDGCIVTDKNGVIMLVIVKSTPDGFVSAAKDPNYIDIMKHFYAEMLMVAGGMEDSEQPYVVASGLQLGLAERERSMVSDQFEDLWATVNKPQRVVPTARSEVSAKQFSVNTDDELFGFGDSDGEVGDPKALEALMQSLDESDYI